MSDVGGVTDVCVTGTSVLMYGYTNNRCTCHTYVRANEKLQSEPHHTLRTFFPETEAKNDHIACAFLRRASQAVACATLRCDRYTHTSALLLYLWYET